MPSPKPPSPRHSRAIVTLAIGRAYASRFDALVRPSWAAYCAAHGCDLIAITQPLDASQRAQSRCPSWQKLLVLSQEWSRDYERIVWVDSDILINARSAPDISAGVPIERIGAVDQWGIPSRELFPRALERMYASWRAQWARFAENPTPTEYYRNRGLRADAGAGDPAAHARLAAHVVQAGVLVTSPAHHAELFEHVYATGEDAGGDVNNYEMPALSHAILTHDLQHWIDPRFNFCVAEASAIYAPELLHPLGPTAFAKRVARKIGRRLWPWAVLSRRQLAALLDLYQRSYFLHFSGTGELMAPFHAALRDVAGADLARGEDPARSDDPAQGDDPARGDDRARGES